MNKFYLVKLENGSTLEVRAPEEMELAVGELCVFKREFCNDSGAIIRAEKAPESESATNELPQILRRMTNEDRISLNENSRIRWSAGWLQSCPTNHTNT